MTRFGADPPKPGWWTFESERWDWTEPGSTPGTGYAEDGAAASDFTSDAADAGLALGLVGLTLALVALG